MANPLDESAEAATRWVGNTPDATLRACGLVNAYQLGLDGRGHAMRRQGRVETRPTGVGTIPVADQGSAGRHRDHRGQGRIRHGMGGGGR